MPSSRLFAAVILIHTALPLLLGIAWGLELLPIGALASAVSFWWAYRYHLDGDSPRFVSRLRKKMDGSWLLGLGKGDVPANLDEASVLLPGFCILVFKVGRFQRRAVFVDGDSTSRESFRQLRMTLRSAQS